MKHGAFRGILVIALGVLVLMRGSTGAPNVQIEFLPNFQISTEHSSVQLKQDQSTSPIQNSNFSQNSIEKIDKTTYKKYPKPDFFEITSYEFTNSLRFENPVFFSNEWKLYVLPLVTRAQDPPASLHSFNQSVSTLADLKGFSINEENRNIHIGRISF